MNRAQPFDAPAPIADYVAATARKVPGFADLHRSFRGWVSRA